MWSIQKQEKVGSWRLVRQLFSLSLSLHVTYPSYYNNWKQKWGVLGFGGNRQILSEVQKMSQRINEEWESIMGSG